MLVKSRVWSLICDAWKFEQKKFLKIRFDALKTAKNETPTQSVNEKRRIAKIIDYRYNLQF